MPHHLWSELNHKRKLTWLLFPPSKLKRPEELQLKRTKEKTIKEVMKNDSVKYYFTMNYLFKMVN
jgi:hypothetical protein